MLMKFNVGILAAVALCSGTGIFAPCAAHAQLDRFYIKGDLGGNWTVKTDLKEFLGPVTPGSKIKFDPGVRVGIAAGYEVTDWFAAEVETGVLANSIDTVTDATRVDAGFANVPFLVNARFHCPHMNRLAPYFGGGLGVSGAVLDVDHLEINGTGIHGSDSDAVFAYQAFGGLRYKLNERMGLSLEYHYFGTTEPSWKADFSGFGSDKIRFGAIQTHAVSVAFDYHF